jgi:hypothetical protein
MNICYIMKTWNRKRKGGLRLALNYRFLRQPLERKKSSIRPKCGMMIELVFYQPSIPPNLLSYGKITDWLEILARTIEVTARRFVPCVE